MPQKNNPLLRLMALLAWLLLCSVPAMSHDLPGKVNVLVYVKPQGEQLQVLVRVPTDALTEVQFPLRDQGFLALERTDDAINDAVRMYLTPYLHFYADGTAVGAGQLVKARISQADDKSFVEFDSALAHINAPAMPVTENIYWKQAFLDVLIAYPVPSAQAKFSLAANLDRLGLETYTVLRFLPPAGDERAFRYSVNPGLIQLEPGWWHAFSRFVVLGFEHILAGIDHLLFLFCLVLAARSVRALIPVITAFTIAHSITLLSSAFGFTPSVLWFPALIETLIALSVFYMACENMFGAKLQRRWVIVFCFGLIHGFGFSFILAERMQFAGSHLVSALFAFNVGVELGQLVVLLITVPLTRWLYRHVANDRLATIVLSAIAAHSAWHWVTERGSQLLAYPIEWPVIDASFLAGAMRWMMLLLASGGALWALNELFARFSRSESVSDAS